MESRARFNEVPEKVLEKVPEGLGAARVNEASSRFRCDSGSVSVQLLGQVPANFGRKNENKLLLLLGIPAKRFFFGGSAVYV